MRERRTLLLAVLLAAAVGAGTAQNAAAVVPVDYHYCYDPQTQEFTEMYDPGDWGPPQWNTDTELWVPNEERPEPWYKQITIVVDYVGDTAPTMAPYSISVVDPAGNKFPADQWATEDGRWTGSFRLPNQPPYETIVFGNDPGYRTGDELASGFVVDSFCVSSFCVPEPVTMGLLALGGLALLRRRRTA